MPRNSTSVSTKQERIATLAKQSPQMAFTSLAYLIDIDWLKEAHRRTRKDDAVGVDGVTAEEYEQDLEGNLQMPARPREVRHLQRPPCDGVLSRMASTLRIESSTSSRRFPDVLDEKPQDDISVFLQKRILSSVAAIRVGVRKVLTAIEFNDDPCL